MPILRLSALKPALIAGMLVLLSQAPAPAQNVKAIRGEDDLRIVLELVRTGLIALHQANVTGNYSVLHDISTGSMRNDNTDADIAVAFQPLRKAGIDLGAAAVLMPQFTGEPTIDDSKMMRVEGTLDTRPSPIAFSFTFQPEAGLWRMAGISVTIQQPPPAAAPAPAAQAPANPSTAAPAPQAADAPAAPAPKPAAAKPAAKPKSPPVKADTAPATP